MYLREVPSPQYFLIHQIHKWFGKASVVRELDNETGEDTISSNNMEITESQTSPAPLLLKKSDVPEASLAARKLVELEKANPFGSDILARS